MLCGSPAVEHRQRNESAAFWRLSGLTLLYGASL